MHKTSELNLKERHFRPYSQVTLDRMALQLALTKARPRRLYIPKMVLDLGWAISRAPGPHTVYLHVCGPHSMQGTYMGQCKVGP